MAKVFYMAFHSQRRIGIFGQHDRVYNIVDERMVLLEMHTNHLLPETKEQFGGGRGKQKTQTLSRRARPIWRCGVCRRADKSWIA